MTNATALLPRPHWLSPNAFPFQSRTLRVGDASMHYVDEGQGPTLLLVHGSPMWSFMYRRAIASLRARYRCIAVDLPGLGLSDSPLRRGHAFEDAATLLAGFVRALELHDITLAVHATAGPCALQVAVREPERFSGLVLSNTFAWPLEGDRRLAFFVRLVSSRFIAALNVGFNLLARVTARLGRRNGSFDDEEQRAILGPYRDRQARRHLQNLLYGVRVERDRFAQLEQDLPRLSHLPTLLLYGAHDNGYRAGFMERWRRLLPNHEVALLEEAGHFPFEDEPEGAVRALERWLDVHASEKRLASHRKSPASTEHDPRRRMAALPKARNRPAMPSFRRLALDVDRRVQYPRDFSDDLLVAEERIEHTLRRGLGA